MNELQADKIIELLTTISERLEQVDDRLVIKREFEGETINIRGKFHEDGQSDGFNDHVTNYNTNLTDVFTYDDPS